MLSFLLGVLLGHYALPDLKKLINNWRKNDTESN